MSDDRQPHFTRMTVSLPVALKRRMERVKGRTNWSAVASRAFEDELENLDPTTVDIEELEREHEDLRRRVAALLERVEAPCVDII